MLELADVHERWRTLRERLDSRGRLSWQESLAVVRQIANGLGAAIAEALGVTVIQVYMARHRVGNLVLTLYSDMLTDLNLTDMEVGFTLSQAIAEASRKVQEQEITFRNEMRNELAETMAKLNSLSEGSTALVAVCPSPVSAKE